MARIRVSVKVVPVDRGEYQVLAIFSDDRPIMRGPIETEAEAETRVKACAEGLALSIVRLIAEGEDATLTVSGQRS